MTDDTDETYFYPECVIANSDCLPAIGMQGLVAGSKDFDSPINYYSLTPEDLEKQDKDMKSWCISFEEGLTGLDPLCKFIVMKGRE